NQPQAGRGGMQIEQLSVPTHGAGPQWWRCDIGCSGIGGSVGDGDLDGTGARMLSGYRPFRAARWWYDGGGGCAVVVGATGGVTQQVVGGQDLAEVVVAGTRRRCVAGVGVMGA